LVRGSFVPPTSIQDVRALTRTRKQLVHEQVRHTQRIQKTLEDANVKLASVVSNILGQSGRAMLDALVAGETDPEKLADLANSRLRASRTQLVEALRGHVRDSHRFLLRLHLGQVDALDRAIAEVEKEVGEALGPFRERAEILTTIPGIGTTVARAIVSEIGTDMSRFPTSGHLISWAGLCPRNDESAGRRRSTRVRNGAPWLKTMLVQSAWAAVRSRTGYLRVQFLRLKSRRGPKKAILAVAASMLTSIYCMLRDGVAYRDLGDDYFDRIDKQKAARRLVRRLTDLGFEVELKAAV